MSIFTKILQGEISSHKVWEDDNHYAFLDIRPVRPGHTLVIPKLETPYLFDMDPQAHAALWTAAHKVAALLKEKTGCARICVGVIGYEVPHAHIHLVPTNSIDEFPWKAGAPVNDTELALMAAKLSS